MTIKRLVVCAAVMFLAAAGTAQAITINYTVDGWSGQFPGPVTPPANAPWGVDGYPGDTVELQAYNGVLDLVPGSYVLPINTLVWTIDYTYGGTATDPNDWSDLLFGLNMSRLITFDGGASGMLSQTGSLEVTWDNDYITVNQGGLTTVYVSGYRIDITPLGLAEVGGSNFSGSNPWIQPSQTVNARFDVSLAPVPEPATIGLLGIGLASLAVTRIRRRQEH